MLTSLIAAVIAVAGHEAPRTEPAASVGEVFFKFDSAALSDAARAQLEKSVEFAIAHPSSRLVLDAHCDPIGTAPYNIGLAIRRATAVRVALIEMGVPDEQIILAFYGEDGARRATYAEDRRVAVWSSSAPLNAIIARTVADGGTGVTWGRPMTMAQLAEAPEAVAIGRR